MEGGQTIEPDPFPFLKLPKDIRLCIYDEVIRLPNDESMEMPTWVPSETFTSLMRTCKSIHQEASTHMYDRHELRIRLGPEWDMNNILLKLDRTNILKKFRSIVLQLDVSLLHPVSKRLNKYHRYYPSPQPRDTVLYDLDTFRMVFNNYLSWNSLLHDRGPEAYSMDWSEAMGHGAWFCSWTRIIPIQKESEQDLTTVIADSSLFPNVRVEVIGDRGLTTSASDGADGARNDSRDGEIISLDAHTGEYVDFWFVSNRDGGNLPS